MSGFKMAPEASLKAALRGLTTGFGSRWAVGGGSGGDGLIQTAGTLLGAAGTLLPTLLPRRQQRLPRPTDTAPAADSTPSPPFPWRTESLPWRSVQFLNHTRYAQCPRPMREFCMALTGNTASSFSNSRK